MIGRCLVLAAIAWLAPLVAAQPMSAAVTQQTAKATAPADDPSGMYTFLREGEFLQLTVEDGKVSGYVSRFGDTDSDKGQFIDQFFDKASLAGDHLSFNTKTVHGVWYEFNGVIATTPGKQPGQEDYRVIKGTLVQHAADASNKDKANPRQVEFKSFPQDLSKP
ncbi:MAG: hypothetical protein WBM04_04985 [Candidatus Korobacteraceae bacterium]